MLLPGRSAHRTPTGRSCPAVRGLHTSAPYGGKRTRVALPVGLGLLAILLGALAHAASSAPFQRFEFARLRMGTTVRIILYAPDEARARRAAQAAYTRIDEIEARLSHFRDDSEVSALSASSGNGPRHVSPDTVKALTAAVRFSELSDGAFDVTVGPLARLWKESLRTKRLPDARALSAARSLVGYKGILIDPTGQTVALRVRGMRLDLGAIAKGYAADEALAALTKEGITSALVDAGGDMRFSAPPPGRIGWKVAIDRPVGDSTPREVIELSNAAVATSGDSYQYVLIGGRRYSHILDPKTGLGMTEAASATVIAPDAMTADALATALCVMPPQAGIRLAESWPGVSALIVRREGRGLRRYVSKGFPP
jgi:thiamine biosynthesis lipoprotein